MDRVFLAPAEFDRRIAAGELLEWSRIGSYRRGTRVPPLRARLDAGQPVLLPLDLPGAPAGPRRACRIARLVLLRPPGYRAGRRPWRPSSRTPLTHDRTERVAEELVGLLGSSYPAPAWSRDCVADGRPPLRLSTASARLERRRG